MKSLLCALILVCTAGISMGADASSEIDIWKENNFSIADCEYAKKILPQYRNILNDMIIAAKQGKEFRYDFEFKVKPLDESATSATLYVPNGSSIPLRWRDGKFRFESDEGTSYKQYFTTDELAADFPAGEYRVDVMFVTSGIQSFYATIPDYNTTAFPDMPDANLSQDLSGKLILNWSAVQDIYEYNVWANLLNSYDVYDNDISLSYPDSTSTPLNIYKSRGNYQAGVTAYKSVAASVNFVCDKQLFSFKKPLVPIQNKINKGTVIAGTKENSDSISFSGLLDAIEADLLIEDGNDIVVAIDANNMSSPLEFRFPINALSLKKGKFSYTRKASPPFSFAASTPSSFKLDTNNGKMSFSAKGLDLTGLACPVTATITIGAYTAAFDVNEVVINGPRTRCPPQLLMDVKNTLTVDKSKVKFGKTPGTDSLTASGIFTVAGDYNDFSPLVITVGNQTFSVPGGQMISKNRVQSCKTTSTEGPLVTARLDYNKATFMISITKATITQIDEVDFGIRCFDVNLQGLETINLGDPFTGTRTMMFYGCNNISDGFTLDDVEIFKIVTSTKNNADYAIKFTGTSGSRTFSMARQSASLLALNPQPQDMPTTTETNGYMLSDGASGAYIGIGQEDFDPLDISVRVSTWTRRPTVVTGTQLAGPWNVKWIFDDHILDHVLLPFETEDVALTITDLGNNQVRVELGADIDWVMNIVGNSLVPVGPIAPTIAYSSMVTDGIGISMTLIDVNANDPTDVSARIGLAAR